MQAAIIHSGKRGRLGQGLLLLLALWLSCGAAQAAPVIYTVGSGTGCNYTNLRSAIGAATAQVGDTAELRVSLSTDKSLGYSWGGNNSEVHIADAKALITITGGYASCTATTHSTNSYTTLTYNNAATDAGHTLLTISNSVTTGPLRRVLFDNFRMVGAFDRSMGEPFYGGGIRVGGFASLEMGYVTVTGFNANYGGGISVENYYGIAEPSKSPRLSLYKSTIDENTAKFGGGINARWARVILRASSVMNNWAEYSGGGILLVGRQDGADFNDVDSLSLMLDNSDGANFIGSNTVAPGVYADRKGGGIFSAYGHIQFKPLTGFELTHAISSNKADLGGGIYVVGADEPAGGPYTLVEIHNTAFVGNTARNSGGALYLKNAVDATVHGSGGPCGLGILRRPLCSEFFGNIAEGSDGGGIGNHGGAIYLVNERRPIDGASRPIVRVYGNMFDGNKDPSGRAAVAATAGAGSKMIFNRNIFINNSANADQSVLISSENEQDVNFRYNTVLDSNTSSRMFNMYGGLLDVTGSILWGTPTRATPFHFVWYQTVPTDAYGQGVYDVPGIAERWGNVDLGAVEQTDIIFANMFGDRPEN